jgi:murein DD-endopeptidase MepM/ murein hydrolase activator NlpD
MGNTLKISHPVLHINNPTTTAITATHFRLMKDPLRCDIHNTYHYFAHLSHFNEDVKEGDIVEPGRIIGYVGSSGYGKKGTSGKFPPHLHYGMYKFNGLIERAYDPFPSLKHWEIEDRKAL